MSGTTGSIPASALVQVIPGVVTAGGSALDLSGLFLSNSGRAPIGQVLSFASAATVSSYFGPTSTEAAAAAVYFLGYTNCTALPGAMLVAEYPMTAVAAWLRGGSLSGMTLAQLQALTGTLTVTVDGTAETSSNITLTAATSFSNAATIIQAAFTSPVFAVTFDSISGGFLFTSTLTGATAAITYASGTLSAGLMLTQATGATISQGAAAAVPGTFMPGVVALTQNWAGFTHLFNPDASGNAEKLAFAAWNNAQNNRYLYVPWDNDVTATEQNTTTSLGFLIAQADYSGTAPVYEPGNLYHATFILGYAASLNFNATNGRATAAYRNQSGLTAAVTNQQIAANLKAYGYNWYGAYATANQAFTFLQPGSVSGEFLWIDSYLNQIWLNNALQLALLELLTQVGSIPYNAAGNALIQAACADPIQAALNYGTIRTGVTLSNAQIAEINNAAGLSIAGTLQSQGWYLLIQTASSQTRAARSSPPIALWYIDGQSIQTIVLDSLEVE